MFEYSENHSANELEEISSSTKQDLKEVKKDNAETQEKGIIDAPKLNNGAVVFDYQQGWNTREIVSRKEWNQYKIRVKKRINNQWYTQKNWDSETFNFTSPDKLSFNQQLWKILDTVIGNNRYRIPKTWECVHRLLNPQTNATNWSEKWWDKTKISDSKWKNNPASSKETKETKWMPTWLRLEWWTYVYTVQTGDSENSIKQKLERYKPLSYLKDVPSGINWYNFTSIPNNWLKIWLEITIPKPNKERIKTISDFRKSQKSALNEMEKNAIYWDDIKKLTQKYSTKHIINVMTAYAKSETCPENFDDKVWTLALFRYEPSHRCPSYGYHHILYEWAWQTAFSNTWINIWQSCNPKESWKLFLAFCIEKAKWAMDKKNRDFTKFFDMENTERCARFYNWVDIQRYSSKLKANFDKVRNS